MILCGHPTGNPNSHHAALAHYESGRLEAFCVPWMPSANELEVLRVVSRFGARGKLGEQVERLGRRRFPALDPVPKLQDRVGEWQRLLRRMAKRAVDADEANQWLMATMARETKRATVTAVHSFEDCSLLQFEEAQRLGKRCVYDMPIGYYPWWEDKQVQLCQRYTDWLTTKPVNEATALRRARKIREMELADVVLAPSSFVAKSITQYADKEVRICPYGVDSDFWGADGDEGNRNNSGKFKFLVVGQCSLRKGTPFLLDLWRKIAPRNAELWLAGGWFLSDAKLANLPEGVSYRGMLSAESLRKLYGQCDALLFPSFFEGYGLIILEALAAGLPVLASDATGAVDLMQPGVVETVEAGHEEAWADAIARWSDRPPTTNEVRDQARQIASVMNWDNYRRCVTRAVS